MHFPSLSNGNEGTTVFQALAIHILKEKSSTEIHTQIYQKREEADFLIAYWEKMIATTLINPQES